MVQDAVGRPQQHGCDPTPGGQLGYRRAHHDLIIAGPGLDDGRICGELVQLEDICPTMLEMVGLAMPPMPKMSSLVPASRSLAGWWTKPTNSNKSGPNFDSHGIAFTRFGA